MKMVCDIGEDGLPELWVIENGVKIAKRGRPDTPHAMTWIPLEPGYTVRDVGDYQGIEVEYNGVSRQ